MEQITNFDGLRLYLNADQTQIGVIMQEMEGQNAKYLALAPNPDNADEYIAFMLTEHYNPALEKFHMVLNAQTQGNFRFLIIRKYSLRSFLHNLLRSEFSRRTAAPKPSVEEIFSEPLQLEVPEDTGSEDVFFQITEDDPFTKFLKNNTPAQIEAQLNTHIIGQPELTKAAADFLYYHALRQLHPQLPQRPLLVAGPSGSGKTEVWRVISKLYGQVFNIRIIDGSSISCEGWGGSFKIGTYLSSAFAKGGILVVDEFDKLARPKHSSAGENVSADLQAEFLKLVEGEYIITENRKQTDVTTKAMGFVMVGAFESLQNKKLAPALPQKHIGFCTQPAVVKPNSDGGKLYFTDEDFIHFGIIPELVGRIAVKCATNPLDLDAYMQIIRGPHSRVAAIEQVLKQYGWEISDVVSNEELARMVSTSQANATGVRWVSAQVETRLLDSIREQGLFPDMAS